jgi:predicted secreted protein
MAISSLTETDADTIRSAHVGDKVELRLPENPSTGYRWSIDITPSSGATINSSDWDPAGAGLGAIGIRKFIITTNEAGTLTIHAKLWRKWEGENSMTQRREFTLQVR